MARGKLLARIIDLPESDKDKILMFLLHQMAFLEEMEQGYEPGRFFETIESFLNEANTQGGISFD